MCDGKLVEHVWVHSRQIGYNEIRIGKDKGWLVALGAYVVYVVSEYIVLWFSRTREYYADRFAGQVTALIQDGPYWEVTGATIRQELTNDGGYWSGTVAGVRASQMYRFEIRWVEW